ncbi:hypothetical protein [Marinobacter sp.]|nr:hypothetical protein [Marinobacter sp.]
MYCLNIGDQNLAFDQAVLYKTLFKKQKEAGSLAVTSLLSMLWSGSEGAI